VKLLPAATGGAALAPSASNERSRFAHETALQAFLIN